MTETGLLESTLPFWIVEVEEDCEDCGGRGYDLGGLNPNEFEYCPSCLGSKTQMVTRNYLAEALRIATGEGYQLATREHVVVLAVYVRLAVGVPAMRWAPASETTGDFSGVAA